MEFGKALKLDPMIKYFSCSDTKQKKIGSWSISGLFRSKSESFYIYLKVAHNLTRQRSTRFKPSDGRRPNTNVTKAV